jgi:hypothetical protein
MGAALHESGAPTIVSPPTAYLPDSSYKVIVRLHMAATIKRITSNPNQREPAARPTLGAGYAKELLDFAVSKGANR